MKTGLTPGVHCISATPFNPDESLDLDSLRSLLDYLERGGCTGALILGVLGESDKLSDPERDQLLQTAIEHSGDRMEISVGITHGSTATTIARAKAAEAAGAKAVMVSPPPKSTPGPALREHFRRLGASISMPVIVQDHPTSSGVKMPVEFIADLHEDLPPGSIVKLEDPPTPTKMSRLLEIQPGYQVFGGLGGVSLFGELVAGSAGAMTGFALVDALVSIVSAYQAGDRQLAYRRYEQALPLMVFEAQPGAGVALRKEILRQQGAIAHATVRQPAPTADPFSLAALEQWMTLYRESAVA